MVARAFNIRLCALCTINSDTPSEQASLYCMKLIDKGWRKNILFCPWAVGSLAFCLLVWRTLFLSHSRPRPPLLSIYLFIFCFCAFRNTVYLYSIFVYEMVLRWRSGLCKADNCLAIYISKSWGKKNRAMRGRLWWNLSSISQIEYSNCEKCGHSRNSAPPASDIFSSLNLRMNYIYK